MTSIGGNTVASLVACGLFALNGLRASDGHVAAFADAYEVEMTPSNVGLLRSLILRSRRFRLVGAASATVAHFWLRGTPGLWGLLGVIAIGFALGSIVDELTRPRPLPTQAVASVDRRTVRTYVERWVLVFTVFGGVATAVFGFTAYRFPADADPTGGGLPSTTWLAVRAVAAVLAVGTGGLALRRIVTAPAVTDEPERQAVRHAVRMAGVLSVIGAINVALGSTTLGFNLITTSDESGFSVAERWALAVGSLVAVFAFFLGMALSLRAFPRPPWFKRVPDIPSPRPNGATSS